MTCSLGTIYYILSCQKAQLAQPWAFHVPTSSHFNSPIKDYLDQLLLLYVLNKYINDRVDATPLLLSHHITTHDIYIRGWHFSITGYLLNAHLKLWKRARSSSSAPGHAWPLWEDVYFAKYRSSPPPPPPPHPPPKKNMHCFYWHYSSIHFLYIHVWR